MQPARIAELLQPFLGPAHDQPLTPNDLASISTYIDILIRWNARINLTAIRDPDQIVTRHFGESLFAARHLFPHLPMANHPPRVRPDLIAGDTGAPGAHRGRAALQGREPVVGEQRASAPEARSVADLGSGAGFPGIPIKLWAPHISLTLIESSQKKATFLREVARALTLTDINIQNTRAEALNGATFDLVTLRAVESFETILPVAASLVARGGCLALLIGTAQFKSALAAMPQFAWSSAQPIPLSHNRILAVARLPV